MLNAAVIGLGPIGFSCARAILCEAGIRLAGLVDLDASKHGRTLDQLQDPTAPPGKGPTVTGDLEAVLAEVDVAVISTVSSFADMAPTIRACLKHAVHVVSSCEEMAWPWYRHAELADTLDAEAKDAGCVLLGTGVNPGYVMDLLAVSLSSMVRRVRKVRCVRRVDASTRREPLQRKVGATMTPERFHQMASEGRIGHRGIAESVAMIAAGLGHTVQPGQVIELIEPVIAHTRVQSAIGPIEEGFVSGMRNTAQWEYKGFRIELDLTMAVGLDDPKDVIQIDGPVPLKLKIPGSIPGDSATVAALLNTTRVVSSVRPGLRTMLDMPPAACRGVDAVNL